MRKLQASQLISCFILSVVLTACGGGGGSSTPTSTPATSDGSVVISGVAQDYVPTDVNALLIYQGEKQGIHETKPMQYLNQVQWRSTTSSAAETRWFLEQSQPYGKVNEVDTIILNKDGLFSVDSEGTQYQELKFPTKEGQSTRLINARQVPFYDVDGDLIAETATIDVDSVMTGAEQLDLPIGKFQADVKVVKTATATIIFSISKQKESFVYSRETLWFAKGLGIVKSLYENINDLGEIQRQDVEVLAGYSGTDRKLGQMPVYAADSNFNFTELGAPYYGGSNEPVDFNVVDSASIGQSSMLVYPVVDSNPPFLGKEFRAKIFDTDGHVLLTKTLVNVPSNTSRTNIQFKLTGSADHYLLLATSGTEVNSHLFDANGNLISSNLLATAPLGDGFGKVAAAFDGSRFCVAWLTYHDGQQGQGRQTDLELRFIDNDGVVRESHNLPLTNVNSGFQIGRMSMAFGDGKLLLVFEKTFTSPGPFTGAEFPYTDYDLGGVLMNVSGTFSAGSLMDISTAVRQQLYPAVVFNGSDFVVTWGDARNSVGSFAAYLGYQQRQIYAARVSTIGLLKDGTANSGGIQLSNINSVNTTPQVATRVGNEVLIAWPVRYDNSGQNDTVYYVRLDQNGKSLMAPKAGNYATEGVIQRSNVAVPSAVVISDTTVSPWLYQYMFAVPRGNEAMVGWLRSSNSNAQFVQNIWETMSIKPLFAKP